MTTSALKYNMNKDKFQCTVKRVKSLIMYVQNAAKESIQLSLKCSYVVNLLFNKWNC